LLNGIELPRDASQQVNVGDLVDTGKGFDSLQPGDLLFFGTKARDTIPEIIQHVALYAGNNEFIHASGKIQINSLDKSKKNFSSYRYNSFIKAKRIISSLNKNGVKSLNKLSCGRNEK
jgi:cell wall-associated NlpC family hydrolase